MWKHFRNTKSLLLKEDLATKWNTLQISFGSDHTLALKLETAGRVIDLVICLFQSRSLFIMWKGQEWIHYTDTTRTIKEKCDSANRLSYLQLCVTFASQVAMVLWALSSKRHWSKDHSPQFPPKCMSKHAISPVNVASVTKAECPGEYKLACSDKKKK